MKHKLAKNSLETNTDLKTPKVKNKPRTRTKHKPFDLSPLNESSLVNSRNSIVFYLYHLQQLHCTSLHCVCTCTSLN